MKRRTVVAVVMVMGISIGAQLGAQTCLGRASFATGPKRVGANYAYSNSIDAVSGDFAYGTTGSVFGGGELGASRLRNMPAGYSSRVTRIGGNIGNQVSVSDGARVQFCPMLGIGVAFGSSDSPTRHSEARTPNIDVGMALGMATGTGDALHFIPSLGIKYNVSRTTGTITNDGSAPFDYHSNTMGTGFSVLALGIARGAVTITPVAYLPISDNRRVKQWGVGVTYSFGRRP